MSYYWQRKWQQRCCLQEIRMPVTNTFQVRSASLPKYGHLVEYFPKYVMLVVKFVVIKNGPASIKHLHVLTDDSFYASMACGALRAERGFHNAQLFICKLIRRVKPSVWRLPAAIWEK